MYNTPRELVRVQVNEFFEIIQTQVQVILACTYLVQVNFFEISANTSTIIDILKLVT